MALMAFVIALSFGFFQKQSLRLDEAQSLWQTSHSVRKILNLIGQDVHVPLYHILLHGWEFLFGNDVWVARVFSLIFFLLSIPAIYLLGKLAYNKKTGLYAAILLSVSPFMNWYGNEIRMYSLFVFLTIVNQYFFISIYRKGTAESWIGFTLTAFLGIYTHYFFFLMLVTDAIFFILNKHLFQDGSFRRFVRISIGLVVTFSPWIAYVVYLGTLANTQPSLAPPTTVNLFNTFSQFLFGFQTDHLNTILVSLWPLTVLLGFLALRKNRRVNAETKLFVLGFLLPNVIAFVVSLTLSPIYLTRYLIFTLPMMYLLLSWLFSTYPRALSTAFRAGLVVVMLLMLTVELVSAKTPTKENYREATQYLEAQAKPSDVIVVSAPFTIYPVLYYYKGPTAIMTLPIWEQSAYGPIPTYDAARLPDELEQIRGDRQNLWLLLSYDQGYQEEIRMYLDTHLERIASKQFSPGMTLYEYKLRYD